MSLKKSFKAKKNSPPEGEPWILKCYAVTSEPFLLQTNLPDRREMGRQLGDGPGGPGQAYLQKVIAEQKLERTFLKAINHVSGGREAFLDRLFTNIYESLDSVEQEFSAERIDERLAELQQEIMSLVRLNARTGLDTGSYSKEYGQLTAEMERLRALRQKLQDQEAQKVIRIQRIDELRQFIQEQDTPLVRFDAILFRRLVENVRVLDGDEVIFVFKTGVEVRTVLG